MQSKEEQEKRMEFLRSELDRIHKYGLTDEEAAKIVYNIFKEIEQEKLPHVDKEKLTSILTDLSAYIK